MSHIISTVEELEGLEGFTVIKTTGTIPTFYEVFNDGPEHPTEFFLFGDAKYIGSEAVRLPVEVVVYGPAAKGSILPLPRISEDSDVFFDQYCYETAATNLSNGEYIADKGAPISEAMILLIEQDGDGHQGHSLTVASEHLSEGTKMPQKNAHSLSMFIQREVDRRVR